MYIRERPDTNIDPLMLKAVVADVVMLQNATVDVMFLVILMMMLVSNLNVSE